MNPYYSDDAVTIYHGDCQEILPTLTFDVIVTDPPYGLGMGYGRQSVPIAGDGDTKLTEWLVDGWSDTVPMAVFADQMAKPVGQPRRQLIWDKGAFGLSGSDLPWLTAHEVIWIYGSGWAGKKRGTVLRTPRIQAPVHPTQKPARLLRGIVDCAPDGVICDPFTGAGSTLRAAKDLGRKAVGIELEERYCEIAAERMAQEVLAL
tara:strand:- start:59 stop:670 length:612 start_codon:yes stop_codon:yes gene_type:complete